MSVASLIPRLPAQVRPVVIAVVAGIAVTALLLQRKKARRLVRVEPRERAPSPRVADVPWGE